MEETHSEGYEPLVWEILTILQTVYHFIPIIIVHDTLRIFSFTKRAGNYELWPTTKNFIYAAALC